MKAPPFLYRRPHDLDAALALLAENAGRAQVLAGGQSLIPTLNMRLSSPEMLVDINRIEALRGIDDRGEKVRIGALVRLWPGWRFGAAARHAVGLRWRGRPPRCRRSRWRLTPVSCCASEERC